MNKKRLELNGIKTKQIVKKTAKTTVGTTFNFIRWIFFFLVIYIAITTVWAFIFSNEKFISNIVTLSIGGFWAFFFGYFGWRIAESVEHHFKFKKS